VAASTAVVGVSIRGHPERHFHA